MVNSNVNLTFNVHLSLTFVSSDSVLRELVRYLEPEQVSLRDQISVELSPPPTVR